MTTESKEQMQTTDCILKLRTELKAKDLIISRLKEEAAHSVSPKDLEKWKQRYIGTVLAIADPDDVDIEQLARDLEDMD